MYDFTTMAARHSVRQYTDQIIEQDKRDILNELAAGLNEESGMHIQIMYDEPKCFRSLLSHYGIISGCTDYICLIGKKDNSLEEKSGYYGELLVLKAQELGLNTCWVGLTHGKSAAKVEKGEKLAILIALGYGKTQGVPHKNKPLSKVSDLTSDSPDWYKAGMKAVMLAPTAINQQSFRFTLQDDTVKAVATGGPFSRVDLGIVKCHFELASGHKVVS